MEPLLERLRTRLAPHGLNLVGTTEIAAYDAVVPPAWVLGPRAGDARTAVVIGNGGAAFWAAFRRHLAADPAAGRVADPLDAFTRHVVGEAIAPLRDELRAARVVYPFEIQTLPVSFVHLAECAGLGRRSLLGVLVHPEYGPWMALRAAILVPFALAAPRPATGSIPARPASSAPVSPRARWAPSVPPAMTFHAVPRTGSRSPTIVGQDATRASPASSGATIATRPTRRPSISGGRVSFNDVAGPPTDLPEAEGR